MKKLLAAAALLLSASTLASSAMAGNAIEGTWRTFDCERRGNSYYETELKFITGERNHYGIVEQSRVEYSSSSCRNSEEIGRRSFSYEYINLFPANSDTEEGAYTIDFKRGARKDYDIVAKGSYRGVPHLFFGRGGPARNESRRPTRTDVNRRFGDASFGN